MKEVLGVIDDTFKKSALTDLKSYIHAMSPHTQWLMYSDYCIGDQTKSNDVASFTIMPYDAFPEDVRKRINSLTTTDIKNKRTVGKDFIEYLKARRLFHISFLLGSRKGLTQATEVDEKKAILESLRRTKEMLDTWCRNSPGNADYYTSIKRKIDYVAIEMSKKAANIPLFRDIILISLLAGYISHHFTVFGGAKVFGWFSDRDKLISAHQGIALDLFHLNHHTLCEHSNVSSSNTDIVCGVPTNDEDGKMWYDEMIRLPDHIAGTLADWNQADNIVSKGKFLTVLENLIADNGNVVIMKVNFDPNRFNCSRVVVSKTQ